MGNILLLQLNTKFVNDKIAVASFLSHCNDLVVCIQIKAEWEEAPPHILRLDLSSLLSESSDTAIDEVRTAVLHFIPSMYCTCMLLISLCSMLFPSYRPNLLLRITAR